MTVLHANLTREALLSPMLVAVFSISGSRHRDQLCFEKPAWSKHA
ncbi:MAG: hypothetical protein ACYDCJ_10690 [Gammaproteobacteria bacterium]